MQKHASLMQTGVGELLGVFGTKVLVLVGGVVMNVILARTLGPAGQGEVVLYGLIPALIVSVGGLGFRDATIYFLAGKRYGLNEVFSSDLFLALTLGIVYAAVGIALSQTNHWPWSTARGPLLWLALSIVPIGLIRLYMGDVLRALGRTDFFNVVFLVHQRFMIVPYVILIMVFGASVQAGVWSRVLAYVASGLLSLWFVARIARPALKKPSRAYLKEGLFYGLKGHIGRVLRQIDMRVDQLIIAAMLDSSQLGYYVVAVYLAELFLYLPDSIGIVLFPKIASRDADYARDMVSSAFRLLGWFSLIAGLGLALVARPLILLLYGADYLPGVEALYWLLPGGLFIGLSAILDRFMSGTGNPQFNTYADVVSLGIGLLAYALLIPRHGIVGAAIGSSLSYGVHLLLEIIFFRKLSRIELRSLLIVQRHDVASLWSQLHAFVGQVRS